MTDEALDHVEQTPPNQHHAEVKDQAQGSPPLAPLVHDAQVPDEHDDPGADVDVVVGQPVGPRPATGVTR